MTAVHRESIAIAVPADRVWPVLIEPAFTAQWMGGAVFETTWEPGSDVLVHTSYNGVKHHDHGMVHAFLPGRRLVYDVFSRVNRLPDRPENRARITLTLEPIAAADAVHTRLTVEHTVPPAPHAYEHVAYFWGIALHLIARLAQGEPAIEGPGA